MTSTHSTHAAPQQMPYVAEARTWYRYAKRLKDCPFNAYQKRQEALAHSRSLRSRSLILPAMLDLSGSSAQGQSRLANWIQQGQIRYPELAARIVQVNDEDPTADEVHLVLEEADRFSSRPRRFTVGRLPSEDAFWMLPLLRIETDALGTGPVIRFFVERCQLAKARGQMPSDASEIQIVIAYAHEAARQWFDWQDERRRYFDEHYRSTFYEERVYRPAVA